MANGPRCPSIFFVVVWASCLLAPTNAYQHYVGFNTWWALSAACDGGTGHKGDVDAAFAAAQRLGLSVVRSLALNDKLPYGAGLYDEGQFQGLDYLVATAHRHGLRIIFSIGNFWSALVGPEDFLTWAEGSASGKTIANFYSSNATRVLYKKHIDTILGRRNSITGVVYKDDPSIMGWDVLNEPRCPGCDSAQKAAHHSWLLEMCDYLHSAAPNQLVFSGTEGYFQGDYAKYNPGAGGMCEGEDWVADNSITSSIQVATAHLYYRQIEEQVQLGWKKLSIDEYLNYLVQKINLLNDLATSIGKPWIAEEFGLTTWFFGEEERKMVFVVLYEKLIASKKSGKPFIGALFWNGAIGGQAEVDGYNVYVDRTPSSPLSLGSDVTAPGQGNATTSSSSGGRSSSNEPHPLQHSPEPHPSPSPQYGRRLLLAQQLEAGADRQLQQERQLQENVEHLDAFHQGPARASCAIAASYSWRMSLSNNLVDVDHYRKLVSGHDMVDIIAAAASVINSG